jgi:hypothetical protein
MPGKVAFKPLCLSAITSAYGRGRTVVYTKTRAASTAPVAINNPPQINGVWRLTIPASISSLKTDSEATIIPKRRIDICKLDFDDSRTASLPA